MVTPKIVNCQYFKKNKDYETFNDGIYIYLDTSDAPDIAHT